MTVSVKLDDKLEERLQRLAQAQQRSANGIVRDAIEQYVHREEARAAFLQEAATAWEAYGQDGLHLTGDETRSWLRKWGTEGETPAPECHE